MNFRLLLFISIFANFSIQVYGYECQFQKDCLDKTNAQCRCFSVQKCNLKIKERDDNPVWVQDDPKGIRCWCKQSDRDRYVDSCVKKK